MGGAEVFTREVAEGRVMVMFKGNFLPIIVLGMKLGDQDSVD